MVQESLLKVDFHSHTRCSPDAVATPAQLVERAREVGLDRIAVTDHGEVEGALEAHALDPQLVIVGEEIRSATGTELIGLYLRERIPDGLPFEEVVERIRDQDGVIYAPHPCAYLRGWRRHAERALPVADLVEVFNARAFVGEWNARAAREAVARGLAPAASTDAHLPWEVGRAYTELPRFSNARELREVAMHARPVALRTATIVPVAFCFGLHMIRLALGPLGAYRGSRAVGSELATGD